MRRRSDTSIRPMADAMTTAASAVFGRSWSSVGREQQQQRDRERAHDARQLGLGARRLGHRCARRAAADREALEEAGREVGDAEAHHLLVRVDRCSQTRRVGAREHARVGEGHERDREAAREDRHQAVDVAPAEGAAPAAPAATDRARRRRRALRDRRPRPRRWQRPRRSACPGRAASASAPESARACCRRSRAP